MKPHKLINKLGWLLFCLGLLYLSGVGVLLRFSQVTDYLYHASVKDPTRITPQGPVLTSPADGTIIYIKRVRDGKIPDMIKKGVSIPIKYHLKTAKNTEFQDGYLIGIYMNTHGVHLNRVADHGVLKEQIIFNGPHMDMTGAEQKIILSQLIPGWISLKKILGLSPFGIEKDADYILKSARETLLFEDRRGRKMYMTRIADFYVGKILTWIKPGQQVKRGQKLGLITWGSQTDLYFENIPNLKLAVEVGDYVYGGETIIARY